MNSLLIIIEFKNKNYLNCNLLYISIIFLLEKTKLKNRFINYKIYICFNFYKYFLNKRLLF